MDSKVLQTFDINVSHLNEKREMGKQIIQAFQEDGIINVRVDSISNVIKDAFSVSKFFFNNDSLENKLKLYNKYSYSGEEVTAGEKDAAEIFTVCKDIPINDPSVVSNIPWPNENFENKVNNYMYHMSLIGSKLLPLIALGLDLDEQWFDKYTQDPWTHMRILHFPSSKDTNMKGIGSHTDYGLLVIASQDDVGGLWTRPPISNEIRKDNWKITSAGKYENDEKWIFITPTPNVVTVFPGDMMQFVTEGKLLSTPHKVTLTDKERFAFAFFYEPSFNTVLTTISKSDEKVHYGLHFTNMFLRCYPDKEVSKRIKELRLINKMKCGTESFK
jgi:isopenicillin N synthase-like dioxygenase